MAIENRHNIHIVFSHGIQKNIHVFPTMFIIILDFLMFNQIFFLAQVKRCLIITYKNGIYELPHELPNDLRLAVLGNYEISGKCLNFIE